jgi:geranylgeranyl diphosphate synthase type I
MNTTQKIHPHEAVEQEAVHTLIARYREGLQETLRKIMPSNDDLLRDLLHYHIGWVDEKGEPLEDASQQGKGLRPTLCLLVCEALGGDWNRALPAAAALEMVHNFSLVHDDIQDGDTERHHRATLWHLWGRPKALVAGDGMLAYAMSGLSRLGALGFTPQIQLKASTMLSQRCLEMIEGQYLDLSYEDRLDIGADDYLEMVSRKTGALIQCATELGALLSESSDESIRLMARCGRSLGIAFQIRDDILGIWGDTSKTGKAAGNDIWRRKKSFPVVYALEHATGKAKRDISHIYSKPEIDAADVERVLSIQDAVKARDHSQALAEKMASDALSALDQLDMSTWGRKALETLIDFLVNRQY